MQPTWKTYTVLLKDGGEITVECYKQQMSEDGKRVEFWMPRGNFIIREDYGGIDPAGWVLVASYTVENIVGFSFKSQRPI